MTAAIGIYIAGRFISLSLSQECRVHVAPAAPHDSERELSSELEPLLHLLAQRLEACELCLRLISIDGVLHERIQRHVLQSLLVRREQMDLWNEAFDALALHIADGLLLIKLEKLGVPTRTQTPAVARPHTWEHVFWDWLVQWIAGGCRD